MDKILILFGAGASYGNGGPDLKPPLGGGSLLEELVRAEYPTWMSLTENERSWFAKDFEIGMETLQKACQNGETRVNFTDLHKEMATYFSRFHVADELGVYAQLFRRFQRDIFEGSVLLATTNYECLLEYSSRATYGRDAWKYRREDPGSFTIMKIHGSCNFGIGKGFLKVTGKMNNCGGETKGFQFRPYDLDTMQDNIAESGWQPALSVYAKGKPVIVGTDTVDGIQSDYAAAAADCTWIITIGIKPLKDDKHIWNPIMGSKTNVVSIDPSPDYMFFNSSIGSDRCCVWPMTFEAAAPRLFDLIQTILHRARPSFTNAEP